MVLGCWFWVVGWVTCSSWLWVIGFGVRFALPIEKSSIRKGNLTKNLYPKTMKYLGQNNYQ